MENQTKVVKGSNIEAEVTAARHGVVDSAVANYGAMRRYATALNSLFPATLGFNWYDIEASDTQDTFKPVHAEKAELYKELKAAKHTNPSTIWARVRKYGKDEREPVVEGNGGETGEGGEAEGSGAGNRQRSPMLRNIEELTELYKFNARQTALPDKVKAAQGHITAALKALGVDTATL